VDVPQLAVPEVTPFQSEMGNEYIRERPLEEIVEKMMQPPVEEEEETEEEEDHQNSNSKLSPRDASAKDLKDKKGSVQQPPSKMERALNDSELKDPTDAEEEEEEKDKEPKFLMNDYIEKAEKEVPQDPYGAETMHADLIIKAE